jgi:nucleoside-diphosphate-sugar epimerase
VEFAGATIAVTGATGFLGRYVVRVLAARGAAVVGVVRNPGRVPELAGVCHALRRADLADAEALARGFEGAAAVVSNAALLPVRNWRMADHERTNVRGTENVLRGAARAGVRRVVHVSSVSVYRGGGGPVDESRPFATERGWLSHAYGVSKARAEARAWEVAAELGLALTTLRPCLIYGAFDSNFMPFLRALLSPPVSVLPAGVRLPMVYAGDVAEAVALALERDVAIGRAYNVTDDPGTLWSFCDAWRRAGGRTPRLVLPVPVPFRLRWDARRAETELGWRPRPVVEGLRETFALEAAAGRSSPRDPVARGPL